MKRFTSTPHLCSDNFLSSLDSFSESNKYWIAFSGGMDSCVLLHLFFINKNNINQNIEAIYVNHGLQEEADNWEKFCKKQCEEYGIAFSGLKIKEACPKDKSIEEWAREKRYELIDQIMNKGDVLFTAHHQDDQVETFFLQALRGAGPRGLSSMPQIKMKNSKIHARPLLSYSNENVREYAKENKLSWNDDDSNFDEQYDRNYLRHKVLPEIESRWPAYRETVSRLINNQQESRALLDDVAKNDLNITLDNSNNGLNILEIKKLSPERQKNLLFYWLKNLCLKTPASRNIESIISDIIYSSLEKSPCVNWSNTEVRRYKNILYAGEALTEHDANSEYKWTPEKQLNLLNEILTAKSEKGTGLSKVKIQNAEMVVRFRTGGEKIHPHNSSHSKTVKQLFQERSVLPWLRNRIPLIYINNELAAIPDFCIDKRYSADNGEASWSIHWSGNENVIQNNG